VDMASAVFFFPFSFLSCFSTVSFAPSGLSEDWVHVFIGIGFWLIVSAEVAAT
jgi:hypothetical protein